MNDDEFKELVFDLDEELLISQKLELARKLLFSISKDNASKEVKDFIKDYDISLNKYISTGIESRNIEPELILDWFIKSCNDETIQKFINWVLK